MKSKRANNKLYYDQTKSKNQRTTEEIAKKTQDIEKKKADHYMLFKVAIENIMRRLKDYEADCE